MTQQSFIDFAFEAFLKREGYRTGITHVIENAVEKIKKGEKIPEEYLQKIIQQYSCIPHYVKTEGIRILIDRCFMADVCRMRELQIQPCDIEHLKKEMDCFVDEETAEDILGTGTYHQIPYSYSREIFQKKYFHPR